MESGNLGDLTAFRETAERFTKKEIQPEALDRDYYPFREFNEKAVETAASIGLLGLTLPESYGGSGQGMRALAAVLEVIARADASVAAVLFSQALAHATLVELGPEETAKKWTSPGNGGGGALLALPLYSDPEELPASVTAERLSDGVKLTGELDYVACLPVAQATIVPAEMKKGEIGLVLVTPGTEGVKISDPVVSLGLRGFPAADLKLDGVFVPNNHILGGSATAAKYATVAERFRGPLAAIALGIVEGACAVAMDYCMERYQAKKMIIEHHMVRRMLSGMSRWIDVGSTLVARACNLADEGVDCSGTELLSIHETVTHAATRATTDAVQVLGGYGYMHDYGQEKRMRDAKQLQAIFGTSPTRVQRIMERRLA